MCLYPLISSASCCNFAKHLLDPLHGAASVQVGVWATAGDCGYSVPRLGILGASHDMGKHVSLPKTWSGQHLAACIHVLAVYWWGCRGLHTGSRPPDSASSEADDQFLGGVTADSGPVAGDADTATTPYTDTLTRQPGDHQPANCLLQNSSSTNLCCRVR